MTSTAKRTLRIVLATTLVAAFAVIPSAAQAGALVADAPNCDSQTFSQTFLPWTDIASYTLNPGGSFENGAAGWTLDGASVKSGNEPFNVTSATDANSLDIAPGGSATSAPICVGIDYPDIRFFARSSNAAATLKVEVLFETSTGDVVSAPIGAVTGGGAWAPTAPFPIVANLLPLLPGSRTPVAFRFSATGGCFRIDDLYVDPYRWS